MSSLLGFATPDDGALAWGRALLAVLGVIAAVRLITLRRVPPGLWVVLAIGVVFWLLTAYNASYFRSAETSRYQYLGVVFLLMAVAELARGVRPSRTVIGLFVVGSLAAVAGNLVALRDGYHDLQNLTPVVRGDLAGLEIAADTVDPGPLPDPEELGLSVGRPARRRQLPVGQRQVRLARVRRDRARLGPGVGPPGRRPGAGHGPGSAA